jgi:hypothetical protein
MNFPRSSEHLIVIFAECASSVPFLEVLSSSSFLLLHSCSVAPFVLCHVQMNTSIADAERALLAAHEALAVIKMFVAEHEAKSGSLSTVSQARDTIFNTFMHYVRSSVTAVARGTLCKVAPGSAGPSHVTGDMAELVSLLCDELEAERRDRAFADEAVSRFNATMLTLRLEDDVTQVYKHRIVELQAVINGTKKPQDIRPEVGIRAPVVPTGITVTEEQQRAEALNSLSRLTGQMKDKLERVRADNLKVTGEKGILVAENRLLADRVKVLEAQLGVMSASSAVNLRELHKQRTLVARLAAQKDGARQHQVQPHQLQPGECVVGGIVMDREVALWLHDVYNALLANPAAAETLRTLRGTAAAESSGPASSIGRASADETASSESRPKRTPSASTRDTNSRPSSRPASGSVPTYGQTRGYTQSFTEFIADPDPEVVE